MLQELDVMQFDIPELNTIIQAKHRPIVIITSNDEKELPMAFLRRCIFHYINFPEKNLMKDIVQVHFPNLKEKISKNLIYQFYRLRNVAENYKKPSTSELIDWIGVLLKSGLSESDFRDGIPFLGSLIKKEHDLNFLKQNRPDLIREISNDT